MAGKIHLYLILTPPEFELISPLFTIHWAGL